MEHTIKVKDGVKFKELNKYFIELCHALNHCCITFGRNYVITSANDGKHSKESYHYKNMAWDIRLNDLPSSHWYVLQSTMKASLGKYWDILVENTDSPTNVHLHCEADMNKIADLFLEMHPEGDR